MAFTKLCHRKNSRGERIYFVRYYLPGFRGTERKYTIGNVSSRRAKEIAERVRSMVVQGIDPKKFAEEQAQENGEKQKLRLSQLEEAYLKYCAISNQQSTIELKQYAYKTLRKVLGNCYADNVTPEKIEAWMMSFNGIAKTTINIRLRTIRAMFNWGIKRGLINENPFDNSGIQQFKVADSDPEDYFTKEEVVLILETLKSDDTPFWRLAIIALETGGRLNELMSLTGMDIDLKNGRVLFRGPTTKTGQRRYAPLRAEAVEMIKEWEIKPEESVFAWKCPNSASRKFRYLLEKLNLRKTSAGNRCFHTLRHTYASHLLMSGVNIFTVSRWMGHSSVRVTEKHYGHLIPDTVEVKLDWGY